MLKPWGRDPASIEPRPTAEKPWPWHRWRELDDAEFLRYLKTGEGLYNESQTPSKVVVDESPPPANESHLADRLTRLENQVQALTDLVKTALKRDPPPDTPRPFQGIDQ